MPKPKNPQIHTGENPIQAAVRNNPGQGTRRHVQGGASTAHPIRSREASGTSEGVSFHVQGFGDVFDGNRSQFGFASPAVRKNVVAKLKDFAASDNPALVEPARRKLQEFRADRR
jgi:hypothetical protein